MRKQSAWNRSANQLAAILIAATMTVAWPASAHAADEHVEQVHLMFQKLRATLASMKDLDDLRRAGLSPKDINRMKRAIQRKVDALIEQTIVAIDKI